MHKHVYRQVLWAGIPISYFILVNTLIRDPSEMLTNIGLDNNQVPRYTFFQGFLVTFAFYFYKHYYNRESEDEINDVLLTLGLAGIPTQAFAMYYWAAQ